MQIVGWFLKWCFARILLTKHFEKTVKIFPYVNKQLLFVTLLKLDQYCWFIFSKFGEGGLVRKGVDIKLEGAQF